MFGLMMSIGTVWTRKGSLNLLLRLVSGRNAHGANTFPFASDWPPRRFDRAAPAVIP